VGVAAGEACKYTLELILDMIDAHFASPQVAAKVILPPAAPEPLSLFDLPDQDDDNVDEENED
jgi:hypothetical protein